MKVKRYNNFENIANANRLYLSLDIHKIMQLYNLKSTTEAEFYKLLIAAQIYFQKDEEGYFPATYDELSNVSQSNPGMFELSRSYVGKNLLIFIGTGLLSRKYCKPSFYYKVNFPLPENCSKLINQTNSMNENITIMPTEKEELFKESFPKKGVPLNDETKRNQILGRIKSLKFDSLTELNDFKDKISDLFNSIENSIKGKTLNEFKTSFKAMSKEEREKILEELMDE